MNEPIIKLKIRNLKSGTKVTLIEHNPNGFQTINSLALDRMVDLVNTELSKWHSVKRISWDSWIFTSSKDADKFYTLFSLKWAK